MFQKFFPVLFMSCFGLAVLAQGETRPVLVCSTTQIADFARQIVADDMAVDCILAPGADPHTYQPTPGDAERVRRAHLVLENGLHLEGKNWMAQLARDSGKPLVTCSQGIQALKMEEDGVSMTDPHAWFSPRAAAVYCRNILHAVKSLDPEHASRFEARTRFFLDQLRVLDAWIRRQFHDIPASQRILVTSHDAFNYFCSEYGFENRAPVGWSTGAEVGGGMTPQRRRMVVDSIRGFGVGAVFVETSVNPKLLREIAKEAGVQIGGTLYSDSMGERGSAGETYLGMMRENVLTIVRALAEP